jgi:uncharacterized NAD-dependent epimerase/dehydratase family protein
LRLEPTDKVALLMHEQLCTGFGKLGHGMLRYGAQEIVAIVDCANEGGDSPALTGIPRPVPIVGDVAGAALRGAGVLVIGIAPPGGLLPDAWRDDLKDALSLGMSVVNPLHAPIEFDPELTPLVQPGRWIWDVRVEPPGLAPGTGLALGLTNKRLLTVGSDMSVGKMTAGLELARAANEAGVNTSFVATGQVGICITGHGVPLDAVRLDYATGAIEREVMRERTSDLIIVEGQGALCHPASTATLALMRGCMPTHLLFVHRARQAALRRMPDFAIPKLTELIELNEAVASACGAFPRPKTIGVALNTGEMSEGEAVEEIERIADETGLPVTDPVRFGCEVLLSGLLD